MLSALLLDCVLAMRVLLMKRVFDACDMEQYVASIAEGQRWRADIGRKVIGLDMRRSATCVWKPIPIPGCP